MRRILIGGLKNKRKIHSFSKQTKTKSCGKLCTMQVANNIDLEQESAAAESNSKWCVENEELSNIARIIW